MNELKRKKLNVMLENFILKQSSELLTRASMGWIYALSYDKKFLIQNFELKKTYKKDLKKKNKWFKQKKSSKNFDLFKELQELDTIKGRWEYIKKINLLRNLPIFMDSFESENDKIAIQLAREFLSSNEKLNILVLGAGCCGLFFANNLKKKLGQLVNILVCENRVQKSRIIEPYSRNWLTNLPKFLFNKKVDTDVTKVFDWFSNGDYIGVKLNMIEILLLESCKNKDIKFLFKEDPYDDLIKEPEIDLIVDATAGKVHEYYPNHKEKNILLKIPTNKKNDYLEFFLKETKNYHYPFFLNKQIINYHFKIVGIKENLLASITEYINNNNHDNIFYVWVGKLIKELNEILIIINIKEESLEIFYHLLKKKIPIEKFEQFIEKIKSKVDYRIIKLVKIILKTKTKDDEIYLEPPFSFSPRIKLFNKNLPKFYNKIIIPIGDSYYTGNAKVGNGLGMHLLYIDELAKTIKECF
tara:strand:- start:1228 stop:2637 length:1410 start_codon:yes stop_codon:yes gene_type:complete